MKLFLRDGEFQPKAGPRTTLAVSIGGHQATFASSGKLCKILMLHTHGLRFEVYDIEATLNDGSAWTRYIHTFSVYEQLIEILISENE